MVEIFCGMGNLIYFWQQVIADTKWHRQDLGWDDMYGRSVSCGVFTRRAFICVTRPLCSLTLLSSLCLWLHMAQRTSDEINEIGMKVGYAKCAFWFDVQPLIVKEYLQVVQILLLQSVSDYLESRPACYMLFLSSVSTRNQPSQILLHSILSH